MHNFHQYTELYKDDFRQESFCQTIPHQIDAITNLPPNNCSKHEYIFFPNANISCRKPI